MDIQKFIDGCRTCLTDWGGKDWAKLPPDQVDALFRHLRTKVSELDVFKYCNLSQPFALAEKVLRGKMPLHVAMFASIRPQEPEPEHEVAEGEPVRSGALKLYQP